MSALALMRSPGDGGRSITKSYVGYRTVCHESIWDKGWPKLTIQQRIEKKWQVKPVVPADVAAELKGF